jgi:hypothetical protein
MVPLVPNVKGAELADNGVLPFVLNEKGAEGGVVPLVPNVKGAAELARGGVLPKVKGAEGGVLLLALKEKGAELTGGGVLPKTKGAAGTTSSVGGGATAGAGTSAISLFARALIGDHRVIGQTIII